jgi:hypothetical protein
MWSGNMKARFRLLKARISLLFGMTLALAGAVPVAYSAALLGWQLSVFSETRSWIALPAALPLAEQRTLLALAGLVLFACGALIARRQKMAIAVEKQRRQERLRRVEDYRRDADRIDPMAGRREPFMSASEAKAEVELERALMSAAAEAARERQDGERRPGGGPADRPLVADGGRGRAANARAVRAF